MRAFCTLFVILSAALRAENVPALAWSAYLGQAGGERTSRPVLDSAGNIYITGRALAGLPVPATSYQATFGGGSCGTTAYFGWVAIVTVPDERPPHRIDLHPCPYWMVGYYGVISA